MTGTPPDNPDPAVSPVTTSPDGGPLPRLPGPVGTPTRRTYPRGALPSDADRPLTRCPPVIIADAIGESGLGVWVLVPEESDDRVCSYEYAGGIV
jgi:hypothetical protein